jgi:hypothetical protein
MRAGDSSVFIGMGLAAARLERGASADLAK